MKITKESTRRALRTALQAAIALPTIIPALYVAIGWATTRLGIDHPAVRVAVAVLAGLTAVTKVMAWAEEHGYIRPILRYLGEPETNTTRTTSEG